jgi:hypothetical protein
MPKAQGSNMSRQLAGGAVGLGEELRQRPHAARGALLQFEYLRKTRGAQCPGRPPLWRKAWPGWPSYVPCSREGQEEQIRCFTRAFFGTSFHEDCVLWMNTELLGHVAISWHR